MNYKTASIFSRKTDWLIKKLPYRRCACQITKAKILEDRSTDFWDLRRLEDKRHACQYQMDNFLVRIGITLDLWFITILITPKKLKRFISRKLASWTIDFYKNQDSSDKNKAIWKIYTFFNKHKSL